MKKMKPLLFVGLLLVVLTSCNTNSDESFAYGNFESVEIFIPAENSGIVKELYVEEGTLVEKGQKIGHTDTLQLHLRKQQVKAAKKSVNARLVQINSQIKVQEVSLLNLQREYKRFGSLFLEEAATKKQMDDLEGQIALTEAQIQALQSQKLAVYAESDAQEAQVNQLKDQISRSTILSPSQGQVLEVYVRQGEMAVAGRPVVKIADISYLILRVFIDGNQLSFIALGDKVEVLYDGPEGIKTTEGTLSWISSKAEFTPKIIQTREDRVNLVYAVKVRVANDGELKIGMPGEIKLIKN
jgi:HlyD family secretion protein